MRFIIADLYSIYQWSGDIAVAIAAHAAPRSRSEEEGREETMQEDKRGR